MNKQNFDITENTIDIKSYISSLIRIWYFFPISIIIFLIFGYIYNIKTTRKYTANSTLLLRKDSKRTSRSNDMIKGFGLFDDQKSVLNEVAILSSFFIAEETYKQNKQFVNYYQKNKLRIDNIYIHSPYQVNIDYTHPQTLDFYSLNYINDSTIEIKNEKGFKNVYDYLDFKLLDKIYLSEQSVKLKLNQWHETEHFKIQIVKNPIYDFKKDKDKKYIKENYYFSISDIESLAKRLQASIKAEQFKKDADIISLSIVYDNPDEAKDLLNDVIEIYSYDNLNEKNRIASLTINFIDEQLGIISDSLNTNENRLENFRRTYKVIDVKTQSTASLEKITLVDKEIAAAKLRLKYFNYLNEYISNKNEFNDILAPSIMGVSDQILNNLLTTLLNLSNERNKLLSNTTSENPLVIKINKQITDIKKAINESVNSLINTTNIQILDLNKQVVRFEGELDKIPETERSLIGIQRKFNINNDIYTLLLQKRAESSIAKASNMPDTRVIDSAQVSYAPISPKKQMIYLISIFLGILIPIIYIIIRKNIFDYFDNINEVSKYTNIPIIGTIAHSNYNSNNIVFKYPKSPISESFRAIRTKLEFIISNNSSNVLMITSSVPNEGKSFLSINLATTYAVTERKTLIIGLDLRNPQLHKEYNISNKIGLSTYLAGKTDYKDCILKTDIENLDVLPSGPIPPNPSELILRKKMSDLITELKNIYDFIIIDTPPILLTTDAVILLKYADAVVYTVRNYLTRKPMLNEINILYKDKNIENVSIVINDIKSNSFYGYSYGYGYIYGQEKTNKISIKKLLKQNKK